MTKLHGGTKDTVGKETMVFGIKVILAAGLRGYKEEAMVHGIKVILVVSRRKRWSMASK